MEKPYRDRKRFVKIGNSNYVVIPNFWIKEQERRLKIKLLKGVVMEISDGKIELTPLK